MNLFKITIFKLLDPFYSKSLPDRKFLIAYLESVHESASETLNRFHLRKTVFTSVMEQRKPLNMYLKQCVSYSILSAYSDMQSEFAYLPQFFWNFGF